MTDRRFEDIRPYEDSEICDAMKRIADSEFFPELSAYIFPEEDVAAIGLMMKTLQTADEFQSKVMSRAVGRTIERSISEFSFSGLERLSPSTSYLFVANHRDIVLDSSLVQYVLFSNGYPTTEITFGANLMCMQLLIDIGRANKMFRVERGGDSRAFYKSSAHLSDYIRHTITEKHRSVWIAQRNGRTKDGRDITDQGLIKMFGMSGKGNASDNLAELNIVPLSVSYEWEPCDLLKAHELYQSRRSGHYEKKPGEDLKSILTGILQPKGKVHLEFCAPIQPEELGAFGSAGLGGEFHRNVARLIDRRINSAYRLTANNYIAADLLSGKSDNADRYTAEQAAGFEAHERRLLSEYPECDFAALQHIFRGIYGNWTLNV